MVKNINYKRKKLLCVDKKTIITFVVFCVCVGIISFGYYRIVVKSVARFNGFTIVIDAGHGGRDGGSVGANGTVEKEINLKYAYALKDKLVDNGFCVQLTRKTDDGLYSNLAQNKKVSDMNERLKIIKRTNPNLVISIHMNSFSGVSANGATTYYRKGDQSGKLCADLIQQSLNTYCGARFKSAKVGDYFILNSSYYTCVLLECGFISNPEEERKLNTVEYRNKFIDAVFKGILLYFGNKNI